MYNHCSFRYRVYCEMRIVFQRILFLNQTDWARRFLRVFLEEKEIFLLKRTEIFSLSTVWFRNTGFFGRLTIRTRLAKAAVYNHCSFRYRVYCEMRIVFQKNLISKSNRLSEKISSSFRRKEIFLLKEQKSSRFPLFDLEILDSLEDWLIRTRLAKAAVYNHCSFRYRVYCEMRIVFKESYF